MKQPSTPPAKKKRFHFQFGVRKRMRTDLIVVGSLVGVSFLLSPAIGMVNALACAMGVITVFISTWYDLTLEPVKNFAMLSGGILGVIFTAFLGYCFFPPGTAGYTVMMTVTTFCTFFLVIYLFTSEEKGNFYMPLLLNFSSMLYAPVYGMELLIRVAIFCGYILVIALFQLVLYKNKFRKQIRTDLAEVIRLSKAQVTAIFTYEPKARLVQRSQDIEKALLEITRVMGPKLARLTRWQSGHDVMRTVHILRRINTTVTASYINGDEVMTRELYNLLEDMFRAIDQFEKDAITETEVIAQFDLLFSHLDSAVSSGDVVAALQSEMEDFVSGEVRHTEPVSLRPPLWERVREKINLYNVIFAAKASTVAALGVLVTCLLQIENASMFIMTIAVLAQPYVEVGSKKVRLRIINTLFALAIFLIAFSIPGSLWLHMAILMAMILVGDMFFQFETNVIGSTMLAVVSKTATAADPTQMLSISLYRFSYVAAAGLILLLVDVLIFPKRLTVSLEKQMAHSLAINQKLRAELFSPTCSTETLDAIILEKRRANQKVKHINQFVQRQDVSTCLIADEGWLNRLTLIIHRIQISNLSMDTLRQFTADLPQQPVQQPEDLRKKSILLSLNEVFDEIFASEQLAAQVSFS